METSEYSRNGGNFELKAVRHRIAEGAFGSLALANAGLFLSESLSDSPNPGLLILNSLGTLGGIIAASGQHARARIAEQTASALVVDEITNLK